MTPPKNKKYVRALIGIVNYYRYIWARRSHLLHPLTELTPPKAKFKWIYVVQKAFDDIKHNIAHNTLLLYPDFNKRFDIHMYARNYQLGAVIIQNGRPNAFFRFKWTETKTRNTVIEKE